jgi:hypothetical protein
MFDELPSSISVPPSLRGGIELKAYCLSLIAAAARRAAAYRTSYASTRALPVVALTPETTAV